MTQRVTFDTNVLDLACRPERFPKDPRQSMMQTVHKALADARVHGFYSVTMLTIEGIMRRDRAKVFSGTHTVLKQEKISTTPTSELPEEIRSKVDADEIETIDIEFAVEQPDRKPLHAEVIARMRAAKALGVRVLKAVPRIGAYKISDPTDEYYLSAGSGDDLTSWIKKAHAVSKAIEARGLGVAQIKALGVNLGDPETAWFHALDRAPDIHQERAIERAFGEWADADAIASHIAYGLDVFCSADVGNSNGTDSILDPANRAWLNQTYGINFMSFEDLAKSLDAE
jgi:hypothetical protein